MTAAQETPSPDASRPLSPVQMPAAGKRLAACADSAAGLGTAAARSRWRVRLGLGGATCVRLLGNPGTEIVQRRAALEG